MVKSNKSLAFSKIIESLSSVYSISDLLLIVLLLLLFVEACCTSLFVLWIN